MGALKNGEGMNSIPGKWEKQVITELLGLLKAHLGLETIPMQ